MMRRLALWIVPAAWRSAVSADVNDEAAGRGKGELWRTLELLRIGLAMRIAMSRDALAVDVRYAVRALWRSKRFAAGAIATLVLGLGVNLAMFSVVDTVLFRPLPFAHVERLVTIWPTDKAGGKYWNSPKLLWFESRNLPAVEAIGVVAGAADYRADGAGAVSLTEVSVNLLNVLGVAPSLGRNFVPADTQAPRRAVLLSHETWRARFDGSPTAIGAVFRRKQEMVEVVGILPPDFALRPAYYLGRNFDGVVSSRETLETARASDRSTPAIARLAPGVSVDAASSQLNALAARLGSVLREAHDSADTTVIVEPLRQGMFYVSYKYFRLVAVAASLVGLLACANLTSLLLARGRSRVREAALRSALGASRGRSLAVELWQAVLLSLVALGISLLALKWVLLGIRAIVPATTRVDMAGIDGRVAGFGAVVALFAALVSGLWPAWRASRIDLVGAMSEQPRQRRDARTDHAPRLALLIESALAVVIVAGAVVIFRSFAGLLMTDLGFAPAAMRVVSLQDAPRGTAIDGPTEMRRYLDVLDTIRRQPGLSNTAGVDSMMAGAEAPVDGGRWNGAMNSGLWRVSDGFFNAIGARVIAGRDITRADIEGGRPVALVSETAARQLWPGQLVAEAIGRTVSAERHGTSDVIGVVADLRENPALPVKPMIYAPIKAEGFWRIKFAVRPDRAVQFDPHRLETALGSLGVESVSVDSAGWSIANALEGPRAQSILFGMFAAVAIGLAVLGLFAVASLEAALRGKELAVRSALGASERSLRGFLLRQSMRPVAIGVGIGLVATNAVIGIVQAFVVGIDAHDWFTLSFAALLVLIASTIAAWIPARRASRTDPAVVLRAN